MRDDEIVEALGDVAVEGLDDEDLEAALGPPSEPEDDPWEHLRGRSSGDLEADLAEEVEALRSAFLRRARQEGDRFRRVTDSEYWVALCFESREQKERFLQRSGLLRWGDKYLDGRIVARRFGVDLG